MGRHHHHSFRGDSLTRISRRPNGRNRDGEITHPTQVTPVAAVAQTVPGVRAQVDPTIMEMPGAAVALTEPKKTLTCIADAAERNSCGGMDGRGPRNGALRNLFNQVDISGTSFRR